MGFAASNPIITAISCYFGKHFTKPVRCVAAIVGLVACLAALICINIDWQMLQDEMRAIGYQPSAQISSTADTLKLTRKGKSIFYATHPEFQNSNEFNSTCGNDGEKRLTLGCYYRDMHNQEKLYLFDNGIDAINEDGIVFDYSTERSKTALHELLHAVYDRYDSSKQKSICWRLDRVSAKIPSLEETLSRYPEEQRCTESFARIGSEYIVSLNIKNGASNIESAPISNKDYSIAEQAAISDLTNEYRKYFELNYSLSRLHWKNQNQVTYISEQLDQEHTQITTENRRIKTMVADYYRTPTHAKLNRVNAAIKKYNEKVRSYRKLQKIYSKICDSMDSEKIASVGSINNL